MSIRDEAAVEKSSDRQSNLDSQRQMDVIPSTTSLGLIRSHTRSRLSHLLFFHAHNVVTVLGQTFCRDGTLLSVMP